MEIPISVTQTYQQVHVPESINDIKEKEKCNSGKLKLTTSKIYISKNVISSHDVTRSCDQNLSRQRTLHDHESAVVDKSLGKVSSLKKFQTVFNKFILDTEPYGKRLISEMLFINCL